MGPDGAIHWCFPVVGPDWARFLEVEHGWTAAEYEGLDLPILSIQAEQETYMVNKLTMAGAPAAMVETARRWAVELDNVSKQRGRDALAAAAPQAVMLQYENTQHWLHLQSPERVVQDMRAFLDRELVR